MSHDVTADQGTTPGWQPATPPPPGPDDATLTTETVPPRGPRRRNAALVAGAAALVLGGGLVGFGLGRATTSSDDPGIAPAGQQVSGDQVPGQQEEQFDGNRRGRDGEGDGRRLRPGAGQLPGGLAPEGQLPGGQFPGGQAPDNTDSTGDRV